MPCRADHRRIRGGKIRTFLLYKSWPAHIKSGNKRLRIVRIEEKFLK